MLNADIVLLIKKKIRINSYWRHSCRENPCWIQDGTICLVL